MTIPQEIEDQIKTLYHKNLDKYINTPGFHLQDAMISCIKDGCSLAMPELEAKDKEMETQRQELYAQGLVLKGYAKSVTEQRQEIERLKGLIDEAFSAGYSYRIADEHSVMFGSNITVPNREQFKKTNNI